MTLRERMIATGRLAEAPAPTPAEQRAALERQKMRNKKIRAARRRNARRGAK